MVPCDVDADVHTRAIFAANRVFFLRCRRVRAPNAPASSSQPLLRLANCFSNLIQENRSPRAIHYTVVAREG